MKQNTMYAITLALLVGLGSFGVSQAYASDTTNKAVQSVSIVNTYGNWNTPVVQQQNAEYQVCVFTAWDGYMDQSLSTTVLNQVMKHTINATIVSMKEQLLNHGSNCATIIKIDRALNQNYWYTDHGTKYTMDGTNTATVFTYRTELAINPSSGGGSIANSFVGDPNSLLPVGDSNRGKPQGHASGGDTFTPMNNISCMIQALDTYHQGIHDGTQSSTCDPFANSPQKRQFDEYPKPIIINSVEMILKKLGV